MVWSSPVQGQSRTQLRDITLSARYGQYQRWLTTVRCQKYLADSTYRIIIIIIIIYYDDDDDGDDVFNKPLREFFILCFYVVPFSTTTAPPTEKTTKTTSTEKISSTGNEITEGKLGRSASQRREGSKNRIKKHFSENTLCLALLSGLFTAPLLKIRLLCFFSF